MAEDLPDVYLRFREGTDPNSKPRVPGDSLDEAFPGKEGWLAITQFTFGFGWGGTDPNEAKLLDKIISGKATPKEKADYQKQQANKPKPDKKKQDDTFKAREFKFSRTCSPASIPLVEILRSGKEIPRVEVVVCRAAAAATPTKPKESKIPFLELWFEKVRLKECGVTTSKEDPISESVEFVFKVVRIATIWTDNATGQRQPGDPLYISFDFENTKGKLSWAKGDDGKDMEF